ncbi:hypothetical protein [Tumebacillus flagellatus]|uniref:hypothetical protein n=1 Tax=Tumebacillus flagellatus TaxID=1157490 RepID=UPI00137827B3|nr:hypothetical protein [Tumebacillus flagellatus]
MKGITRIIFLSSILCLAFSLGGLKKESEFEPPQPLLIKHQQIAQFEPPQPLLSQTGNV